MAAVKRASAEKSSSKKSSPEKAAAAKPAAKKDAKKDSAAYELPKTITIRGREVEISVDVDSQARTQFDAFVEFLHN